MLGPLIPSSEIDGLREDSPLGTEQPLQRRETFQTAIRERPSQASKRSRLQAPCFRAHFQLTAHSVDYKSVSPGPLQMDSKHVR